MTDLTAAEIRAFDENPTLLAKWYCELNSWGWPSRIPNPEPEDVVNHVSGSRREIHDTRRWALLCEIVRRIGQKAVSREWNRTRMTDEEFEAWWLANKNFFSSVQGGV